MIAYWVKTLQTKPKASYICVPDRDEEISCSFLNDIIYHLCHVKQLGYGRIQVYEDSVRVTNMKNQPLDFDQLTPHA